MDTTHYKRPHDDYSFYKVESLEDCLSLWKQAEATTKAPFRLFQQLYKLKLKAKEKVEIAELMYDALQKPHESHKTMVTIFGEFIAKNSKLSVKYGDFVLDSPEQAARVHIPLIRQLFKAADEPEKVVLKIFEKESRENPDGLMNKHSKARLWLLNHYLETKTEPPNRELFCPYSAERRQKMSSLAPLPMLPFKGERVLFESPLDSKLTKEFSPSLATRYFESWFLKLNEFTIKHRRFEEEVTVRPTNGSKYLIKNRGYCVIGWLEPYQYEVAIDQKDSMIVFIDHETQELSGSTSPGEWLSMMIADDA